MAKLTTDELMALKMRASEMLRLEMRKHPTKRQISGLIKSLQKIDRRLAPLT